MALAIEGLTQRQQVLADILWACDSMLEVEKFISGLPTYQLKQEATTLVNLMILQTRDTVTGNMTEANRILDRIKNL